jgi:peptidylprolyl isomerase
MKAWFLSIVMCAGCLQAEENLSDLFETMGYMMGKNLESLGVPVDTKALIRGIEAAQKGKETPLTEQECLEKILTLQEQKSKIVKEEAQKQAEQFLAANGQKDGVVTLSDVQYVVLESGEGEIVENLSSPLVRIKIEGESFEELIDLNEAQNSFKQALIGMKEGEVRKLYIHPKFERKNKLGVYEIEVIKADASMESHAASEKDVIAP